MVTARVPINKPPSACWLLCWLVAGGAGPETLERRNTGCILAPVRLAPVPFLPLSTCWLLCWLVAGVADGLEDAVACCNPSTLWLTAVARPTLGAGDTNPRPPPAAPSPSGTTWGVCWTMSASGLPCWSVTDAAGGLEDAVACCNPSKLSLSLSAVERVAAMAERPWPPPCGGQSSPCAQLVRKVPYVSETKEEDRVCEHVHLSFMCPAKL